MEWICEPASHSRKLICVSDRKEKAFGVQKIKLRLKKKKDIKETLHSSKSE